MAHVLVIGSTNVDLAVHVQRHPKPGETLTAREMRTSPGGKGANQALAAALNGADVVFAAQIGDDAYAEQAVRLLREAGVDLRHVRTVAGPTGLAFVTIDDAGENSIVIVAGANGRWRVEDLQALHPSVAAADVVVCQGEIPAEVVDAIAMMCMRLAKRFVLNLAPVIAVDVATIRRADPLVVNQHEARLAANALSIRSGHGDDTELLVDILEAGVRSVVLTRGAAPTLVATSLGIEEVPSPTVDVVDTTGAGDAFVGALAAGMVRGLDMAESAETAAIFAADTVTRIGAQESYTGL